MKKKLKIILVTSLVMLVVFGAFLWKMSSMSKKMLAETNGVLLEEKDLLEVQDKKAIDGVKEVDIIPLYLSGEQKNVVTIQYDSVDDVYNVAKSAKAEENLTDIKKRSHYDSDKPLWAYNPYGTNSSSMYVYFKTQGKAYCRYTISVKDSKIPDFTRTLNNSSFGVISKEHEYQLLGLVPGMTNYIIMKMYNKNDELSETKVFSIDMPESPSGADTILKSEEGRSKTLASNGLYSVFGGSYGGKNVWLLYDNSGVLRGETPLDNYSGYNTEIVYDNVLYAIAKDKIAKVNSLGQVLEVYKINGYIQSGEFDYDGSGSIYVIGTERKKNATANSKIIKIQLDNAEVSIALDMDTLLPGIYKKATEEGGKKLKNWIDVNSIQVTGTNQILVSSRTLSTIFKVSNISSLLPKIDYIIADKDTWKANKSMKKKLLTKLTENGEEVPATPTPIVDSILDTKVEIPEPFQSQKKQNAIVYDAEADGLAEGQYYLTMLNNDLETDRSGYYQYFVDETTKTYTLKEKKGFDKTANYGNISKTDEVFVYCCSEEQQFMETDTTGKLIRKFSYKKPLYRVYKSEWKEFWFH